MANVCESGTIQRRDFFKHKLKQNMKKLQQQKICNIYELVFDITTEKVDLIENRDVQV